MKNSLGGHFMEEHIIYQRLSDFEASIGNLQDALKDRLETNHKYWDLKDLFTALAKAQGEMEVAHRSSTNPHFKSKYSSLTELVIAARPALTKYGLAVYQKLYRVDGGHELYTRLTHESGQFDDSIIFIPHDPSPQKFGSYLSYMKRYAYGCIVGVIDNEFDDDGNLAAGNADILITDDQIYILRESLKSCSNGAELYRNILSFNRVKDLNELTSTQFESIRSYIAKNRK